MTILKTFENGVLTLTFEGWLDTTTSPDVDPYIENFGEGMTTLVFDFEKLEYISSAGLRKIASASKNAKAAGAEFRIVNAGSSVMNVLKMTGFTGKYKIEAKQK